MKSITKSLLTMLLLFVAGMVNAKSAVWTAADQGYDNAADITSVVLDANVTVDFAAGSNTSNSPKYYTTGAAVRVYSGNTFTFTGGEGVTISKIKFSFGSGDKDNTITAATGTYDSGVWEGSASEIQFTVDGTSGHRRIAAIEVTYEGGVDVSSDDPAALAAAKELLAKAVAIATSLDDPTLATPLANGQAVLANAAASLDDVNGALDPLVAALKAAAVKVAALAKEFCQTFGYSDMVPTINAAMAALQTASVDRIELGLQAVTAMAKPKAIDALDKVASYVADMENTELDEAVAAAQQALADDDVIGAIMATMDIAKNKFLPAAQQFMTDIQGKVDPTKQYGAEVLEALETAVDSAPTAESQSIIPFGDAIKTLIQWWRKYQEANPEAEAPITAGTYYISNVATGKYLAAGASWGTCAVVNEIGLDYVFELLDDGTYTIESQVANSATSHFLAITNGAVFNDQPALGWTITKVSDGKFTISNGTNMLKAGEDGIVVLAEADAGDPANLWSFVTLEERLATFDQATAENGVDASFLIKGYSFSRNDQRNSAWTYTNTGGNANFVLPTGDQVNYGTEFWNNTFDIKQTLENLPDGVYEFSISGYGTNGTTIIYANDIEAPFENTTSDASFAEALKNIAQYTGNTTGKVPVIGGTLTIGVKRTEQVGQDWTVIDDARLTYYGPVSADDYWPAYLEAMQAAQDALASDEYANVTGDERPALENAISTNTLEQATATIDEIEEAISNLNQASKPFKDAKPAYDGLAAAKAELGSLSFPYAAAEKKAAAEQALDATAASAADAISKTAELYTAFRQYAESNALLEGVEGATVLDVIENPDAEQDIAEPWSVILGEGSGGSLTVLSNESMTDGSGKNNYRYFDGGNWGASAWDVALQQTITLSAGKYYLTVAGRASAAVTLTLNAGENTKDMPAIGNQGGLFDRGWNDSSLEFEVAEDGEVTIGVRGVTTSQYNWMSFTRFRLAQFPEEAIVDEGPEKEAPEGWVKVTTNGNCATDVATSFYKKEYPESAGHEATIVLGDGKNGSRGIAVKSAAMVSYDYDSQFWIVLDDLMPEGTKMHVEFDYKADKASTVGTQSHGEPGAYQHFACIGDVNFTTEWQNLSKDITVTADMATGNNGVGLKSIAFNLTKDEEVTYYFDNIFVWVQKPTPVAAWSNLLANSDLEGDDMSAFYLTEQRVGGPFVAVATEGSGKEGKGIKVQSADDPANDWATQLFIRSPYLLPEGTKVKVSFDYKASQAATGATQAHGNPGNYQHWACIGDVNFTTEWKNFEKEITVSSDMATGSGGIGLQTIAFNLAINKDATAYYFDNIKLEVPEDVVATLEERAAEYAVYPIENVAYIAVSSSDETKGIARGNGNALIGADVTVTAKLAEGVTDYVFGSWNDTEGTKVSTDAAYTFKPEGDTELIATFQEIVEFKNLAEVDDYYWNTIGEEEEIYYRLTLDNVKVTYVYTEEDTDPETGETEIYDVVVLEDESGALAISYAGLNTLFETGQVLNGTMDFSMGYYDEMLVNDNTNLDNVTVGSGVEPTLITEDNLGTALSEWRYVKFENCTLHNEGEGVYWFNSPLFGDEEAGLQIFQGYFESYDESEMPEDGTVVDIVGWAYVYYDFSSGQQYTLFQPLSIEPVPATGISSIKSDAEGDKAPVYDLKGQRVMKVTKGFVIKNGKKYYNK